MRYAFINTVTKEAKKNKNIYILSADLGYTVFENFKALFPNRFINVGVAEQNLINLATGLALSGKTVFVYSIATFATTKAYEQIKINISNHNLPVIIVGSGAGLSYSEASITHHSLEDISIMRSIPNMSIIAPSDPLQTEWATKFAISYNKPLYLRLGKAGEPKIYKTTNNFIFGEPISLKDGKDLLIIATGNIVYNALEAAKLLAQKGINCLVLDMHTIKPYKKEKIYAYLKNFSHIFTIEEHSIIGGLGSTISEVITSYGMGLKLISIGVNDEFVRIIGKHAYLREQLGLSPQKLSERILKEYKAKAK